MGKKKKNNNNNKKKKSNSNNGILNQLRSNSSVMRFTACNTIAQLLRSSKPKEIVNDNCINMLLTLSHDDTDNNVKESATGALRNMPVEIMNNEIYLMKLYEIAVLNRELSIVFENVVLTLAHLCEYYEHIVTWISITHSKEWLPLLIQIPLQYSSATLIHVISENNSTFIPELLPYMNQLIQELNNNQILPIVKALICGIFCNINAHHDENIMKLLINTLCDLLIIEEAKVSNDEQDINNYHMKEMFQVTLQVLGNLCLEPTPLLKELCQIHHAVQKVAARAEPHDIIALECLNNMIMANLDGIQALGPLLCQRMIEINDIEELTAIIVALWSLIRIHNWPWNGIHVKKLMQILRTGANDNIIIPIIGVLGCLYMHEQHQFVIKVELLNLLKQSYDSQNEMVLNEIVSILIDICCKYNNLNDHIDIIESLTQLNNTNLSFKIDNLSEFLEYCTQQQQQQ